MRFCVCVSKGEGGLDFFFQQIIAPAFRELFVHPSQLSVMIKLFIYYSDIRRAVC